MPRASAESLAIAKACRRVVPACPGRRGAPSPPRHCCTPAAGSPRSAVLPVSMSIWHGPSCNGRSTWHACRPRLPGGPVPLHPRDAGRRGVICESCRSWPSEQPLPPRTRAAPVGLVGGSRRRWSLPGTSMVGPAAAGRGGGEALFSIPAPGSGLCGAAGHLMIRSSVHSPLRMVAWVSSGPPQRVDPTCLCPQAQVTLVSSSRDLVEVTRLALCPGGPIGRPWSLEA